MDSTTTADNKCALTSRTVYLRLLQIGSNINFLNKKWFKYLILAIQVVVFPQLVSTYREVIFWWVQG
jgi:hypothetical protein